MRIKRTINPLAQEGSVFIMSSQKMTYLSQFTVKDDISSDDVLMMRRAFWEDGVIAEEEAVFLFSLNDKFQSQNADWIMFFIEAITEYTVNQVLPRGYMTQENMDWMLALIDYNGHVDGATEMMLLVKVLETAEQVPQTLVMYTLEKIKEGILAGDGPLRIGTDLRPKVIDASEVELLRRVLYAVGGAGNVSISKVEAEFLFDLNEQADKETTCPEWQEFFSKAVTSYLMAMNGYEPLAREEVLRRNEWLEERGSAGSFMGEMVKERGTTWDFMGKMLNFSTWSNTDETQFSAMAFDRMDAAVSDAEKITEQEASWLYSLIISDGTVDETEKKMLQYLIEMSDFVPDNLKSLLAAAA